MPTVVTAATSTNPRTCAGSVAPLPPVMLSEVMAHLEGLTIVDQLTCVLVVGKLFQRHEHYVVVWIHRIPGSEVAPLFTGGNFPL